MKKVAKVIAFTLGVLLGIALILMVPTLIAAIAFLMGMVAKWLLGGVIVSGVNALLGAGTIVAADIPFIAGAIGFLSSMAARPRIVQKR